MITHSGIGSASTVNQPISLHLPGLVDERFAAQYGAQVCDGNPVPVLAAQDVIECAELAS